MRDIVLLVCADCKQKNYSTTKNRRGNVEKLSFTKFCSSCGKHTTHKESKA